MTSARTLPPWTLLLVPLLVSAATRGLWAPDEPRRAEVAREVIDAGHWLVLHLCGRPYPDKPPLAYWLFGALGWLSSWNVFVMRLLAIAASAWTAALVARMARRWWGESEATWAPTVLLGMIGLVLEGARVQIDPLLLCSTTAALERAARPASTLHEANRRALGVGAWCAIGGMLKGPVAWIVVLVVLLAWARRNSPAGLRASTRARLGAAALAVLPVACWALLVVAVEPQLAPELFFAQHAGRVAGADVPHAAPIWKYAAELPLLLLPWTVPVLGGLVSALRKSAHGDLGRALAARWMMAVLALFSLISAKRGIYLMPLYPAAALLGARWLVLARASGSFQPWLAWSSALLCAAAALAMIALAVLAPSELLDPQALGVERVRLQAVLLCLSALAAVGAIHLARQSTLAAWSRAHARTFGLLFVAAFALAWPLLDPVRCLAGAARELAALPQRPTEIPCLGVHPEAFRFYAALPAVRADSVSRIQAAASREQSQFLAVVSSKSWKRWSAEQRARFVVLAQGGAGRHAHVVLGSAPAREPAGL